MTEDAAARHLWHLAYGAPLPAWASVSPEHRRRFLELVRDSVAVAKAQDVSRRSGHRVIGA